MQFRNILLLAAATMSLAACARVEPGNVGVEVNQYGSGAGVSPTPKGIGTYFTGIGTSIYEYPVSTHSYTWTQAKTEGSATNEELSFQDKNGLNSTADISVSYHVISDKAPIMYQTYRMDMDGIISGPLRNAVRNAMVNEASKLGIEEIYGPHKAELMNKVQADVQKLFRPKGLEVEQINWASDIRVPATVKNQINQKIANEQAAMAAQASVATAEAEARSRIAKAEGEAKATQIEAEALRTNPQILQQKWIDKWDGKLPTYVAGGNTSSLLNLPSK
jgi:regulator of protease activity HflC (stomatin/prohibitin superfamily)